MDVVMVTYNSEKWIEKCISSLEKANEGLESLDVYIVDNASTDDTPLLLKKVERENNFHTFKVIYQQENAGFSKANNCGAECGTGEIITFINIDTTVYVDTFKYLEEEIRNSEDEIAAWEMRQLPYEHPKLYDPVTRETSWMSGAAFAIRRKVFEKIGGFDENIFMYAEDVDLSWRIRAQGYKIRYCPKVKINHFSYHYKSEVKPIQYVNSIINNLLLRYRYGTTLDILKGHIMYFVVLLCHRSPYKKAKLDLLKGYLYYWKQRRNFSEKIKRVIGYEKIGKFLGWDYEIVRDGAFLVEKVAVRKPLVTIIVRTCQRPSVLKETLISIRNQTYDNIEIIVVEDGEEAAAKMIEEEFADLNIRYFSTGSKQGRSNAGNLGLKKSEGTYINFLDDDDLFFCDHIESLVNALNDSKELAAYSFGFEIPTITNSIEPYKYQIKSYIKRYTREFDEVELCYHNYIPIQCIMFHRELFEELGGFDVSLDYLEDWDLWVRFAQKTKFLCVPKTTSLYKVPYKREIQRERQRKLDESLKIVREKHKMYNIPVSANRLATYWKKGMRG